MNWEAFAAVSTAFTGLVILATALADIEHKELTVLRCFERIGMYVAKGGSMQTSSIWWRQGASSSHGAP